MVAIVTAADLPQPTPTIPLRVWPLEGVDRALQPVLATERVRYVGEPIAAVVARSPYVAEDAAELVHIDYDLMESVSDLEEAVSASAPRLHDHVDGNVAGNFAIEVGDVDQAFAAADLVVEETFRIHRHSGVPLETRGLVAEYSGGILTVWGPTKVSHFNRSVLAGLLGIPIEAVRFVEPAVGGGFGGRGEFYPEDYVIPHLAMLLGRRLAWQEDRTESLVATNQSREQVHVASIAVSEDGRILGLRSRALHALGAYTRTHGATVPAMAALMLPGPYRIPNYRCEFSCVLTNTTPTGTYRGPGRFQANFVRERLVDLAANRTGMDPADFRLRNFVSRGEMPYDTGIRIEMGNLHVDQIYDSGDYERQFRRLLAHVDYEELKRFREEAQNHGRAVGIGFGCFVEKCGIGNWEYARVEVSPSGDTTVFTGLESVGQGIETSLAQICGDALEVSMDQIRVVHGDTALVPEGMGSFASRGVMMGGSAVYLAVQGVRKQAIEVAASVMECEISEVELIGDTIVRLSDREQVVTLAQAAERATPTFVKGVGMRSGLCAEAKFETTHLGYPYGANVALVEVDRSTGKVNILRYVMAYDVGVAINPRMIEGQLIGGFAQGLGGTLLEEFSYGEMAQPQSITFQDYLLPTSVDVPPVELILSEDEPSTVNPLGVKGAGEGGAVGPPAALANAVADALGVDVATLPLSPDRVWRLAASVGERST